MAEGGEDIPLIPMEGEEGEYEEEEEEEEEKEEETSFGGGPVVSSSIDSYYKDNYRSEQDRRLAREAVSKIKKKGLYTSKKLVYTMIGGDPCVSEEWKKNSWYAVLTKNSKPYLEPVGGNLDQTITRIKSLLGLISEEKGKGTPLKRYPIPLMRRKLLEENIDEIRRDFPKMEEPLLIFEINEKGKLMVSGRKTDGEYTKLKEIKNRSGSEYSKKLPKAVTNALGKRAEEILQDNQVAISSHENRAFELEEEMESAQGEGEKNRLGKQIEENQEEIDQLERENEAIRERMSLGDRVKEIFKKYGVTIVGVLAAVGTVIGVIVSNLRSGFRRVAKGVGDGLKTLGKKVGEILPGMIGAIASYLFKVAGEAVGFLAKNAWLLIVAVVIYFVDNFVGKKKT